MKENDGRIFDIEKYMSSCSLCPRKCGVDRNYDTGFCGCGSDMKVARAALHFWEEPFISGESGSGAVFFKGCNMGCVYCQNYEISGRESRGYDEPVDAVRLADIFIELQGKGAVNINLVTPTHYAVQIANAIIIAKDKGLTVPIVYNCSGYESSEILRLLDGLIDIYLVDFKYSDSDRALKYSKASDYPQVVTAAIDEMVSQHPDIVIGEDGLLKSGVVVRHMVMPLATREAMSIIGYLYERYRDNIYISIMSQYTPIAENLADYPEINRKLTRREYDKVVDYAISLGVQNAFVQGEDVNMESFIPKFDGTGVKKTVGLSEIIEGMSQRAGLDNEFADSFRRQLKECPELLNEFVGYIKTGQLPGEYKISGLSVIDILIWQIDHFKAHLDRGEGDMRDNPDKMVLMAFDTMLKIDKSPEKYSALFMQETGTDYPGKYN